MPARVKHWIIPLLVASLPACCPPCVLTWMCRDFTVIRLEHNYAACSWWFFFVCLFFFSFDKSGPGRTETLVYSPVFSFKVHFLCWVSTLSPECLDGTRWILLNPFQVPASPEKESDTCGWHCRNCTCVKLFMREHGCSCECESVSVCMCGFKAFLWVTVQEQTSGEEH